MEFIVGIALALLVCSAAAWLGMDRDRVFYPAVLIVTATYYMLFAVMDGRNEVLLSEMAIAAIFIGFAVAGFKRNLWLVVAPSQGMPCWTSSTTISCTTPACRVGGQGSA